MYLRVLDFMSLNVRYSPVCSVRSVRAWQISELILSTLMVTKSCLYSGSRRSNRFAAASKISSFVQGSLVDRLIFVFLPVSTHIKYLTISKFFFIFLLLKSHCGQKLRVAGEHYGLAIWFEAVDYNLPEIPRVLGQGRLVIFPPSRND